MWANKMFKEKIGHNMEVYVDDLLVKKQGTRATCERFEGSLQGAAIAFGCEWANSWVLWFQEGESKQTLRKCRSLLR